MSIFTEKFNKADKILMEGALLERLKRDYKVLIDKDVALASVIYDEYYKNILKKLFIEYINIANKYNLPIMITTPTRRANKERISNSKYNKNIIKDNVLFLKEIRDEFNNDIFIGGLMGCYGDAYKDKDGLTIEEAVEFHSWQADLFKKAEVDFLYAGIMPTLDEAIGMAKAMERTLLPYIISFMIREDGKLIDGTTISDAIENIDKSVKRIPICYMTNCVHPDIVYKALSKNFNRTEILKNRFRGIQANAACLSPEELDNRCELISSDPSKLAESMIKLQNDFDFKVFGGCCGTDDKYIEEVARQLVVKK